MKRRDSISLDAMFKTLFSRMLITYLSVMLFILTALGVTLGAMFQNQYEGEKESELRREAEEINSVIVERYLDDDKRLVAEKEMLTIARRYDAMIQVLFKDQSFGKATFVDAESQDKWRGGDGLDLSGLSAAVLSGAQGLELRSDLLGGLVDIPVLTLIAPITDGQGEAVAALFLHTDLSRMNVSIRQVLMDVLLMAVAAVLLAFLAVSYITSRITRPIIEMNNTVMRFSKGEFDARVEISTADEVGQLGKSFNTMADELNTLEQARRSFVANVSHELRSPLTSMRGFLEAMADGTIPPEEHEKYLGIVIDENRRMTDMVNDLLDLARIESGQTVLRLENFDLNELIARTVLTFEARIDAKKLDVSLDFAAEHTYVEADPGQIAQVIRNLVDNAIKFTPEGGKLGISTDAGKKEIAVSVRDSGRGIAAEDLPHLFDRFYKAEKAHTPSDSSGTGLGLAIVQRIMEQHGRQMEVQSELGQGACFTFTLKRGIAPQNKRRAGDR